MFFQDKKDMKFMSNLLLGLSIGGVLVVAFIIYLIVHFVF
jgi:hypothetical protein